MKHYQSIGTGLSLLMHLVFILLIFYIAKFTTAEKRLITIDFTIKTIRASVNEKGRDTTGLKKEKQFVEKKEIPKEKLKASPRNSKQKKIEKLTEKRLTKPAPPEKIKKPLPPEEALTQEISDEPVAENVPEQTVQNLASENTEPPVISDTDAQDKDEETEAESKSKSGNQDVASSGNNTSVGSTSSSGKQENASGGASENGEEFLANRYIKRHFNYIRKMIQGHLNYPLIARRMGWSGKVIVSFIVCEDGHVENIRIVESSGFAILDRNAVETIKKISPFPKPPVSAELKIPIAYVLR